MDGIYKGIEKPEGEFQPTIVQNERKPFKVILDLGTSTPSRGNRVFAVMKGASDGGLFIPHSPNKFPGFVPNKETKKPKYNAQAHRDRIFGVHIDKYMEQLKEDESLFNKQFSQWNKCLEDNGVDSVEALFTKIH